MSDDVSSCAEVEALAAELALGTLSGAERAVALAHLSGCGRCRDMIDQLAPVADSLLLLAPPAEPPAGFESRVLAGMGHRVRLERSVRRTERPRRRLVAVGVAAVALVAAIVGAGLAQLADTGGTTADVRTALAQDDGGRWTCRAVAYGGDPAWLFVSLDRRDGATTAYTVEAQRTGGGGPVKVGDITLQGGHGTLATALEVPARDLHSVRVLDQTGRVRYEAEFRPPA
jgi:hypothetical protein